MNFGAVLYRSPGSGHPLRRGVSTHGENPSGHQEPPRHGRKAMATPTRFKASKHLFSLLLPEAQLWSQLLAEDNPGRVTRNRGALVALSFIKPDGHEISYVGGELDHGEAHGCRASLKIAHELAADTGLDPSRIHRDVVEPEPLIAGSPYRKIESDYLPLGHGDSDPLAAGQVVGNLPPAHGRKLAMEEPGHGPKMCEAEGFERYVHQATQSEP